MNHALLPCKVDTSLAAEHHLVPPTKSFACPCGWQILCGVRGDEEDLVLSMIALYRGRYMRGQVYRLRDDIPFDIQWMIDDIPRKGCPALYRESKMN